jgi:hypothetical protein
MGKIWHEQFNDALDLETQINELWAHALKLKNLRFSIPDNILTIAILLSLPPSYGTLQTSIGVMADDKLNLHKVVTLILTEQQCRHEAGKAGFQAHAAKPQNGKDAKNGKKGKKCSNCQRFSHTVKKSKGSGMEGQGPPKWDEKAKAANKASDTLKTAANSLKSIELFMATIDKSDSNNTNDKHIKLHVASRLKSLEHQRTWIVDSGASARVLTA